MSFNLHTFILGLVQGICEFLPVSSSGHLAILQNFFGFNNNNLVAFDLLLHCATVLVVFIYFRHDIIRLIIEWFGGWVSRKRAGGWAYGWAILIANFMTALIGLPLRKIVDIFTDRPIYVGTGLILTAFVLIFVPIMSDRRRNSSLLKIAFVVGIAQGIAVLPGVSRSGMTLAAGLFMGLGAAEAFRFSFLVSIPAVLGATLLEALKFFKSGETLFMPDGYIWAVIAAFVLGLASLGFMRKLILAGKWAYFGLYCLIAGSAVILFSLRIV